MSLVSGAPAVTTSPAAGGFGNGIYPTASWATLPTASVSAGVIFRVTDIGLAGIGVVVVSDGATWVPLGPQIFARSAGQVPVTGTTGETTLATVTIPAGLIGANGGLLLVYACTFTNNANNKTLRQKLGGTTLRTQTSSTSVVFSVRDTIRNRGAANSQSLQQLGLSNSGLTNAQNTSSVDMTVSNDLTITAQLAVGTDTFTLESYDFWLLP